MGKRGESWPKVRAASKDGGVRLGSGDASLARLRRVPLGLADLAGDYAAPDGAKKLLGSVATKIPPLTGLGYPPSSTFALRFVWGLVEQPTRLFWAATCRPFQPYISMEHSIFLDCGGKKVPHPPDWKPNGTSGSPVPPEPDAANEMAYSSISISSPPAARERRRRGIFVATASNIFEPRSGRHLLLVCRRMLKIMSVCCEAKRCRSGRS